MPRGVWEMIKNSYPKLHSYKLKGMDNVQRIPVSHETKNDNPYIVLAEVMNKPDISDVTIIFWKNTDSVNWRTSRNKSGDAVYDMQTGMLLAMGVLK